MAAIKAAVTVIAKQEVFRQKVVCRRAAERGHADDR